MKQDPFATEREKEKLFRKSIIFSLLLHAALFGLIQLKGVFSGLDDDALLEVDLTRPFGIGGNPLLKPGGGTSPDVKKIGMPAESDKPAEPEQKLGPVADAPPTKDSTLKEWVIPGDNTKMLEKPHVEGDPNAGGIKGGVGDGSGEGFPGTGGGWGGGDGEGGGIPLERVPKLLNASEIVRLLKKYYPLPEREAGRQGVVYVRLHLDKEGRVNQVAIAGSGGASFDEAAQKVAPRMRFSPAISNRTAVAIRVLQKIEFKLEDEE